MFSYIFDIGGVLMKYDSSEVAEILSELTKCDYTVINQLFGHELLYQVESGRISCADFYSRYIKQAMPGLSYEGWIDVFTSHYTPNPQGLELLRHLKENGRKVYILSNLAEFHKIAMETKMPDFFGLSAMNFFSYELGWHKPEMQIYEEVCRRIGEAPQNCIFFDDLGLQMWKARRGRALTAYSSPMTGLS